MWGDNNASTRQSARLPSIPKDKASNGFEEKQRTFGRIVEPQLEPCESLPEPRSRFPGHALGGVQAIEKGLEHLPIGFDVRFDVGDLFADGRDRVPALNVFQQFERKRRARQVIVEIGP